MKANLFIAAILGIASLFLAGLLGYMLGRTNGFEAARSIYDKPPGGVRSLGAQPGDYVKRAPSASPPASATPEPSSEWTLQDLNALKTITAKRKRFAERCEKAGGLPAEMWGGHMFCAAVVQLEGPEDVSL